MFHSINFTGSATSREGENAGQFSSTSALSNDLEEAKQESPLSNKLLSFQMSDTESTGSGEMSFKTEPEDSINGIKDEDKTDFASTPPMLRQTANTSAVTRQDTAKTMEWYNLSFDKEPNILPTVHSETHIGLSRISESSLESKSEVGSRDSLINSDSITPQLVFGQDDVDIKRDNMMNVTGHLDENQGSRLSSVLTGQGRPHYIAHIFQFLLTSLIDSKFTTTSCSGTFTSSTDPQNISLFP